ncbi:MAG TPA: NAD-dependent deacylase [Bacteroidia bacterium]|nr:NAD-dependent deacylase [Bacteroidia bacterium]
MKRHPRLVVLSGAGMSADSGIRTFRGADGLWENYRIEDVATPMAWQRDPELVQRFYNERRKQVLEAQPNEGHLALARLEACFDVRIITQNIDDLHERAGSSSVLHLHGEIRKSRSSLDPSLTYPIEGWELRMGERCAKGSQLRPHIVWFGEMVPLLPEAAHLVSTADVFLVVGTSLAVYPAASLVDYVPVAAERFVLDPEIPDHLMGYTAIRSSAASGLPTLALQLIETYTTKS